MLKLYVVICAGWFSPHAGDMHSLCEYYDLYGARKCLAYQHSSLTVVNLWRTSTTEIFDGIKKCSEFNPKKLNLPKHPKPETLKDWMMDGAGILSLEAFRDYSGSFFHFFIPKKRSFFRFFGLSAGNLCPKSETALLGRFSVFWLIVFYPREIREAFLRKRNCPQKAS